MYDFMHVHSQTKYQMPPAKPIHGVYTRQTDPFKFVVHYCFLFFKPTRHHQPSFTWDYWFAWSPNVIVPCGDKAKNELGQCTQYNNEFPNFEPHSRGVHSIQVLRKCTYPQQQYIVYIHGNITVTYITQTGHTYMPPAKLIHGGCLILVSQFPNFEPHSKGVHSIQVLRQCTSTVIVDYALILKESLMMRVHKKISQMSACKILST